MIVNQFHPHLRHPLTGCPLQAVGIVGGRPVWPILGGAPDDGGDGGAGDGKAGDDGKGGDQKTFTQADLDAAVDKIAAKIREDERKKVKSQFADYDDLKAKAQGNATVEEQLNSVKEELAKTQREALRRTMQARYGINDDDAELFLVGDDAETLERQAKRLKEQADERSKNGGRVPGEGRNGRPTISDEKSTVRTLFGSGS